MDNKIKNYLQSLQEKIDCRKANLELSSKVNRFLEVLYQHPIGFDLIYHWKKDPVPLVILSPSDISFQKARTQFSQLIRKRKAGFFLERSMLLLLRQYADIPERKSGYLNKFLSVLSERNLLSPINESLRYCSRCGRCILTNKPNDKELSCPCGSNYDLRMDLMKFPDVIKKVIQNNHLLELFALKIFQKIDKVELIGHHFDGKGEQIYTSIQYSGIGVGAKDRGEFDLLGLTKTGGLVFVECKFNETTLDDIRDFLDISKNLFFAIRDKFGNRKKYKIIVSYDTSKLGIESGFFSIQIKNSTSSEELVKSLRRTFLEKRST